MQCSLLLVDDQPEISAAICRAVQHEGFDIAVAHNASDALEVLARQPVDVIVSDDDMPGDSGARLLAQVRDQYPEVVRIMLSGQTDMDAVVQAVNSGAIDKFLPKPWSNDTLRSLLREAAARASARGEVNIETSPHATLCHHIFKLESAARLIVLEVRNSSVNRLMTARQQHALMDEITSRAEAHLGALLIPVQALEDTVFAFASVPGAHQAVQELLHVLCQPFDLTGQLTSLSFAAGYVDMDCIEDVLETEHWVRDALVAVTATAYAGEVTAYSRDVQDDLHERHTLERDMGMALARGEFFLQLQPQVSGASLAIEGAESLCRWQHPERGLIAPQRFIDLAERNGFIHELGIWVIRQTCAVLSDLASKGAPHIKLAVNVSPRQFALTDWIDVVEETLARGTFDPAMLEFEITESTIMADPEHARRVIERLKSLGLAIAMDDFGTGHSSLALLKELPVDVLKFDRALVRGIEDDDKSRKLFKRLVEMSQDLGVISVAEGVETASEVRFCRDLGCHLMQGFAFHRPLDTDDFCKLVLPH